MMFQSGNAISAAERNLQFRSEHRIICNYPSSHLLHASSFDFSNAAGMASQSYDNILTCKFNDVPGCDLYLSVFPSLSASPRLSPLVPFTSSPPPSPQTTAFHPIFLPNTILPAGARFLFYGIGLRAVPCTTTCPWG
jgi:hypothetical protein